METFNIEKLTVRQLDFLAYNQDCIIGKLLPSDGKTRGVLPEKLQGGWVPRWVGTTTKSDRGTLIILPGDDRTRDIVYHSTIRKVKGMGLGYDEAKQIAKSKVRFKYEIINAMVDYLKANKPVLDDALMYLATEVVPYESWIGLWSDILPESAKGFDQARMMALATGITDIKKKLAGVNNEFATTSISK